MKKVFLHKRTILQIIILFITLSNIGFITTSAMAVIFNDGGIHVIDGPIGDVFVYNNVNPPYGPTTVNIIGYTYSLEAAEDSIINMFGALKRQGVKS